MDILSALLFGLIFLLWAVQDGDPPAYTMAALLPPLMLVSGFLLPRLFGADPLLLSLLHFTLGLDAMLCFRTAPESLPSLACCCAGALIAFLLAGLLSRRTPEQPLFPLVLGLLSLMLFAAPLFRLPLSFRLSDLALPMILPVLAFFLSRRHRLETLFFLLASLALLLLSGDGFTAAALAATGLLLLWSEGGGMGMFLLGAVVLAGFGVIAGSLLPAFAPERWVWQSPDTLAALSNIDLFGTGISPDNWLPLSSALEAELADPLQPLSNPVWALVQLWQHFGALFGVCLLLLFSALTLRAGSASSRARNGFQRLLAIGAGVFLSLRALIAWAACFGLLPLPAFSFPLLSSDPAQLAAEGALMGLVSGVLSRTRTDLEEDVHLAMLKK